MSAPAAYPGSELDLFAGAANWKQYWRSHVARFVSGDVAEVGAGIGTNTGLLCHSERVRQWTCLEPDPRLAQRLRDSLGGGSGRCTIVVGTLEDVDAADRFDSVVYIDVLEHIDDDRAELRRAAGCLRPGGTLIVLAPAHQWLFTAFDTAIGHYRRYTKGSLAAVVPPGFRMQELIYLDSVGLLASAANRFVLRSASPTAAQIKLWDRIFVTGSRLLDPLLGHSVGKSVLGIWRKDSST
jgi:SAM-dependent methyltransferase